MNRKKSALPAAALMTLLAVAGLHASDFYASPDGTPEGDGSVSKPWDLQTALNHPATVEPGDTIWLNEGTYKGDFTSVLAGTEGAPITVKPLAGKWARIEGAGTERGTSSLVVKGSWTQFMGFEVTNPNHAVDGGGLWLLGPNNKIINLVVHNVGNNGFWEGAVDLEIYGCLFNLVGGDPQNQSGYPIYMNNTTGTKRIVDNIFCNNFYYGIHVYTQGGSLSGFELVRNAQNYFAPPVASGTYSGGSVKLPMNGLAPAQPIGKPGNILPAEQTGKEFNVFIVSAANPPPR